MLRRKTEAKPTDRAAGELRDALAKTAKRSRQGRRNFFPLTLNTLRFECRSINDLQRAQRRSRFERKE